MVRRATTSREPPMNDTTTSASEAHRRAVRLWLYAVAVVIFALVVVGGATRLTGSGLSIVEWRPVTGTVPPLTEAAWQAEFKKYQTIPQYQQINHGMSLVEFKTIYWWEWTHRLLGRLVGVVFLLPFLWFLWRGWIAPELRPRLWGIFALGAVQGAVGWWMVYSGLADRVSVSQYRLATHLTLACIILAAVLATAQRLSPRAATIVPRRIRAGAFALVVLVLVQIYLGALVAGLHAGLIHNTWPLIDGALIPAAKDLFFETPLWRNFFENTLTVQFDHRMGAYLLVVLAVVHLIDVARTLRGGPTLAGAVAVAGLVLLQAGIGIWTLLSQVPLPLALTHQAFAVILLACVVVHASRLTPQPRTATQDSVAPSFRAPAPR
jgi:cytochrome c oxidase assembly protein subunit 15